MKRRKSIAVAISLVVFFLLNVVLVLADCHSGSPGDWSYCSSSCKCDAGEGDCDSDSECKSGLKCVSNVGAKYGWSSSVDVCDYTGSCNCECTAYGLTGCKQWDNSVGDYNFVATVPGSGSLCSGGGCQECRVWYGLEMGRKSDVENRLKNSGYHRDAYGLARGLPHYGKPYGLVGILQCQRWHGYYRKDIWDNNNIYRTHILHTEGPECDPDTVGVNPLCRSRFGMCALWHNVC